MDHAVNEMPPEVADVVGDELTYYADKQLAAAGDWTGLLARFERRRSMVGFFALLFGVFSLARVFLLWSKPGLAAASGGFAVLAFAICWSSWRAARRLHQARAALQEGAR